jgi:hypothetical protein
MSTSTTSAANSARGDLLLVAALVVTVIFADLALRATDQHLSGNLAHVAEIPAIAERIATSGDPRSTVVLGNSLANNGIDAAALAAAADLAHVAKVTPDGTSYWDWQCLIERQVLEPAGRQVGTIVMPTAWHLMSDETRADPSRLGALFCSISDLQKPADLALSGPADVGEFLLARISRVYALRDTMRNRALAGFIPHYKRFANEQNTGQSGTAATSREVSYAHFTALAAALEARGTRLVVVMMPVRESYEIDAPLIALAAQGRIRLLDYRQLPGIEASSFLDQMHLGPAGRAVLTTRLADDLVRDLTAATTSPR